MTFNQRENFLYKHLKFRNGPVPFTACFKASGRMYRAIGTTQERKWACDPEIRPYIRSKRRKSTIPSAWDDIYPSNWQARSWKDCTKRKRQWAR